MIIRKFRNQLEYHIHKLRILDEDENINPNVKNILREKHLKESIALTVLIDSYEEYINTL